MEPFSILIIVLLGATLAFWPTIVQWVRDSIVPWLRGLHPAIAQVAEDALTFIDDKIATPARLLIRTAWRKLREVVIDIAIEFVELLPGTWQRVVRTFLVDPLRPDQPQMRETVVDVAWDDIPETAKEHFIKKRSHKYTVPFSELRDKEIDEMILDH